MADMKIRGIALKGSRHHFDKGKSVPVLGVHIGMYLEYEAGEFRFIGMDQPSLGPFGAGGGGNLNKAVQEFPHPKIVQGRPKEYGLLFRFQIGSLVEIRIYPMDQFQVVPQILGMLGPDDLFKFRTVQVLEGYGLLNVLFAVATEKVDVLFKDVVNALEVIAHPNGKTQRGHR